MYPVTYTIVKIENTQFWSWFIKLLLESIEIENIAGWTFITDRQKILLHCRWSYLLNWTWFGERIRSHFNPNSKYDLLCNNICEAFNKYILKARDKPIITILEMIRRILMVRFQTKRELLQKHVARHGDRRQILLCPKI